MIKNLLSLHHNQTKRNVFERMTPDKPENMFVASQFERDYWDGERKHGYGGYKYDGRWKDIAEILIEEYNLTNHSSVIDLGCGKAYLLYEISQLLPGITIHGVDISNHAIHDSMPDMNNYLRQADLNNKETFDAYDDNQFELCLSLMTLHNLGLPQLENCLSQIGRISKKSYVAVESYRDWNELTNLQCWALTCKSFFSPEEWEYLFEKNNFKGDYEFLYFS